MGKRQINNDRLDCKWQLSSQTEARYANQILMTKLILHFQEALKTVTIKLPQRKLSKLSDPANSKHLQYKITQRGNST